MQALRDLGIGREDLDALGIRIAKFGMTFPLEPRFIAEFAEGLETILVIEEKRSFLELQLRDTLYNQPRRPDRNRQVGRGGQAAAFRRRRARSGADRARAGRAAWDRPARPTRIRMLEEIEARERRPVAHAPAHFLLRAARTTAPRCCSRARWRAAASAATAWRPR